MLTTRSVFLLLVAYVILVKDICSFRLGVCIRSRTSAATELFAATEVKVESAATKISNGRGKLETPLSPTARIVHLDNDHSMLQLEIIHAFDDSGSSVEMGIGAVKLVQVGNPAVPRSFLPTILAVLGSDSYNRDDSSDVRFFIRLLEKSMQWYLDSGGRLQQLEVLCPDSYTPALRSIGFEETTAANVPSEDEAVNEARRYAMRDSLTELQVMIANPGKLASYYENRLKELLSADASTVEGLDIRNGELHTLNDIFGRLLHAMGNPKDAIHYYTQALIADSQSAAVFRNLGSAYHAVGDVQLAFASYQQALQVDPTDALVYLKLAYFYEEFASKDWIDAEKHAEQCYRYYLEHVDAEDTSVLTRLGNMLVREHDPAAAIIAFEQALAVDDSLHNVWFNKAHAQMKIDDLSGAAESLRRTLELQPRVIAAKHMLKALSEEEATTVTKADESYVVDLFDNYASTYDKHGKKLLYAAPRVIRQELANVYKARYGFDTKSPVKGLDPADIADAASSESAAAATSVAEQERGKGKPSADPACVSGKPHTVEKFVEAKADEPVGSSCQTYTSFMNGTMDILDLGCGTGQAGSWLKDYAKSLAGVDISEKMVAVAKSKNMYNDLYISSLDEFFATHFPSSAAAVSAATSAVPSAGAGGSELQRVLDSPTSSPLLTGRTFDVVVGADVFAYIGDLANVFKQATSVLRPGGLFVFTVESVDALPSAAPNGFRLQKSGRFGHRKDYIDRIVASLGEEFCVKMSRKFCPRLEVGEGVDGYLYIVERKA